MDTNQPTANPAPVYAPATRGMFGTGVPSSVAFAIALLLFLLPFSEIKCGGTTLMSQTGLGYALGSQWKIAGGLGGKDLMGDKKDITSKTTGEKEGNARYFILGALGLGVLGLIFSLLGSSAASKAGIVVGIVGAGALIGFMLDVKKWFNDGMAKQAAEKAKDGADSLGLGKMGEASLKLSFSPWFYVAVVAFLAGAFFCFKRMRAKTLK